MTYRDYVFGNGESDSLLEYVSGFVRNQSDSAAGFNGRWMLVAQWKDVHPYPHAEGFLTSSYQEFVNNVSKTN